MLKRHLAEAEEHIATGDKNIARQRDVIAQLERDGRDTASGSALRGPPISAIGAGRKCASTSLYLLKISRSVKLSDFRRI